MLYSDIYYETSIFFLKPVRDLSFICHGWVGNWAQVGYVNTYIIYINTYITPINHGWVGNQAQVGYVNTHIIKNGTLQYNFHGSPKVICG